MLFFIVTSLVFRICSGSEMLNCFCKNNNETFIFSDTAMNDVEYKLSRLHTSNENLQLHLDMLVKRLENQTESFNELSKKMTSRMGSAHDDINRLCSGSKSTSLRKLPRNCAEATATTHQSGLYSIRIESLSIEPFLVACDEDTQYGGWTVIQRRLDGSVDFYRNWTEYKNGFGNLRGEFFIGLDKLHALTSNTCAEDQELLIVMEDYYNVRKLARYAAFVIGSEAEGYPLKKLGTYIGSAGDALRLHVSRKFTTRDRDNDPWREGNCARDRKGAWWYYNCYESNLNGQYLFGYSENGIVWRSFHGSSENLKFVQMMVRPRVMVHPR